MHVARCKNKLHFPSVCEIVKAWILPHMQYTQLNDSLATRVVWKERGFKWNILRYETYKITNK